MKKGNSHSHIIGKMKSPKAKGKLNLLVGKKGTSAWEGTPWPLEYPFTEKNKHRYGI